MNCRPAVRSVAVRRHWVVASLAVMLTACGTLPAARADLQGLLPTPLLLVGELHDAPEHQALQRDTVRQLAARGELAALVMEMVEQGRQTTGLAADASEAKVRESLDWSAARNAGGWSWDVYGPVVMAAVRAGVPVTGGNLPRAQMRTVMGEAALDDTLPAAALQQQRDAIREGHCQLLPESQVAPMTRIQLARDRAMAQTAMAAVQPGRTVLLVAGNGHVRKDLGVPRHLPAGQGHRVVVALSEDAAEALVAAQADRIWFTPARKPQDHCADLRQMAPR